MSHIVINGNNLDVLKNYPDNHFDSVVTDPPYGLGKEPDTLEVLRSWADTGFHDIKGSGFMGKEWDAFVPQPLFWKEVFRVLKHGGHVLAFYGTRTYDWGVMAMRVAGFEVRDTIYWHYGSGFPKSHNISKAIDKLHGAEREVVSVSKNGSGASPQKLLNHGKGDTGIGIYDGSGKEFDITAPATDEAKKWDGWGTALKPASEPIVVARKPIEKGLSVAENVLKWGTGGINIDGCRVKTEDDLAKNYNSVRKSDDELGERGYKMGFRQGKDSYAQATESTNMGRFPANLIMTHHPECECKGTKKINADSHHTTKYNGKKTLYEGGWEEGEDMGNKFADADGKETIEDWQCHEECPIRIMDEQSGVLKSGAMKKSYEYKNNGNSLGKATGFTKQIHEANQGGASRFFYCAKASKSERNKGLVGFEEKQGGGMSGTKDKSLLTGSGNERNNLSKNFHPTVKPVKLMQYLVRLVTPPNGLVLDPFCGSGTTGIACKLEGFQFVGIEQDAEYTKIAQARITKFDDYDELEPESEQETTEVKEEAPKKYNLIQTSLF